MSDVARITRAIAGHRYRYASESELQDGLAEVLAAAGVAFEREVQIGDAGRIDFLADGGVGLEVKVGGSLAAATRQLHRYAASAEIEALVLVTGRGRLAALPSTIGGKPLEVVDLSGGAL